MRVGEVAYRLILPAELAGVHKIFHISMLRKYIPDPSHVIHHEPLDDQLDFTIVDRSTKIIDTK